VILFFTPGCSHKTLHLPAKATNSPTDNSYMDLTPGSRLRILVPVLHSGTYPVVADSQHQEGNTIVLSATNLAGYEMFYYSIKGKADGRIRLQFTAAEKTMDGKTVPEPNVPKLPFSLPQGFQHIRLIYMVRQSQSDHNMAITAAKNLDTLNVFTKQLKGKPEFCKGEGEIFCSWVPAGVAVRPESLSPPS